MNSFTVFQALQLLQEKDIAFQFMGDESLQITHARRFDEADDYCVCFNRRSSVTLPEKHPAALIILRKGSLTAPSKQAHLLFVDNPDLVFCLVAALLLERRNQGIHETALISQRAAIGDNVSVDAFTVIGDDVQIMDNVAIGQGCVIENAIIGNNTRIFPGVKIGSPGLGSQKDASGMWHDFPHFGRVIIGDNVVIQDNAVINRGTLSDTVIEDGVRIAPLCWIAHGVCIGQNALIAQAVTVAGSASLGENAIVWGNASVRDGVAVGAGSVVGMGSVVVRDIPDGEIWTGNPAKPLKED